MAAAGRGATPVSNGTEIFVVIQTTHDCGQIHKQTLSIQECSFNMSQHHPPLAFGAAFSLPVESTRNIDFTGIYSGLNVEGVELKDGWLLCVKCGKGEPLSPLLRDANTHERTTESEIGI